MHVGDFPEHEPEREKVNGHWGSGTLYRAEDKIFPMPEQAEV